MILNIMEEFYDNLKKDEGKPEGEKRKAFHVLKTASDKSEKGKKIPGKLGYKDPVDLLLNEWNIAQSPEAKKNIENGLEVMFNNNPARYEQYKGIICKAPYFFKYQPAKKSDH